MTTPKRKRKSIWCILGFHDWEFVPNSGPDNYRCTKCGEWQFNENTPRVI